MAHLIDKDALVAGIEKRINFNRTLNAHSRADECNAILSFINSLEVKEVDLKKELSTYLEVVKATDEDIDFVDFAKHFFELGQSVSNSTKVTTPDIDDVLKQNGVNPYSKEAKIIKESYYMVIEKLTQKGE